MSRIEVTVRHIRTVEVRARGPIGPAGIQGPVGPKGDQGDTGPSGTGDATLTVSYDNTNSVTISHSLNKYPNVVLRDSAGTEYEAEVIYNSISSVTVNWNNNMTGTITLN